MSFHDTAYLTGFTTHCSPGSAPFDWTPFDTILAMLRYVVCCPAQRISNKCGGLENVNKSFSVFDFYRIIHYLRINNNVLWMNLCIDVAWNADNIFSVLCSEIVVILVLYFEKSLMPLLTSSPWYWSLYKYSQKLTVCIPSPGGLQQVFLLKHMVWASKKVRAAFNSWHCGQWRL